jgi:nucleoside-diphosphate-sugar epimerase
MRVALTGGTGFLGSHVLDALSGHDVSALTRRVQPAREGVTWITGALDDFASLAKLCDRADAVIHVAGIVNGSAAAFEAGNVAGTIAMLAAAPLAARFVHVSSLSAREPGMSLYGASKARGEALVVASERAWSIVRPPAIYGPRDTDNLDLFRLARRGVVPLPPGGRLSVIHATDLARLIVALATAGEQRVYEADDGVPGGWDHRDFARAIGEAVGKRVLPLAMPRAVMTLAARADHMLRGDKAKLTPDRIAYFCHPDWVIDPAARPHATLWQPQIATPAGLAATARWYRDHGWL